MAKAQYFKVVDGEPFTMPNGYIFHWVCCDCGLVHDVILYSSKLRRRSPIEIAMRRENRRTASFRKKLQNVRVK